MTDNREVTYQRLIPAIMTIVILSLFVQCEKNSSDNNRDIRLQELKTEEAKYEALNRALVEVNEDV